MLNLNDITFNKQLGNLTDKCFEMPYVSYCQPLCASKKTDMILLTSQKNELYEIIEEKGLSPALFEFQIIKSTINSENKATRLIFKDSAWYYLFETDMNNKIHPHNAKYSPGESTLISEEFPGSWNLQISFFYEWLDNLKREISIDDKWERLQLEIDNVNLKYEYDDSKFTAQEYDFLQSQMEELKIKISTLNLVPDQINQINNKLDNLTELAMTLSKTDWKSLFVGSIVSIIIQLSLSREIGQELWMLIRDVFSTYFLIN